MIGNKIIDVPLSISFLSVFPDFLIQIFAKIFRKILITKIGIYSIYQVPTVPPCPLYVHFF